MRGISIITPFYLGERYIPHLQEMVNKNVLFLKRNGLNIDVEFLIVNDSPQVTLEINCRYDSFEYQVITYKTNKGIHGARTTGVKKAKGEYILFLDQDDEISDDFLYNQLSKIGDADVIVSNAWIETFDNKYKLYKNKYQMFKVTNIEMYTKTHNQIVSPGQCLIKKLAIPKEWIEYSTKNNGSDDLLLWVIMLARKNKFIINDELLYTHKYTGDNLSQNEKKMIDSTMEIANYLYNISDIDKQYVVDIIRSRKFKDEWLIANFIGKCILILKNPGLVLRKIQLKIKTMI